MKRREEKRDWWQSNIQTRNIEPLLRFVPLILKCQKKDYSLAAAMQWRNSWFLYQLIPERRIRVLLSHQNEKKTPMFMFLWLITNSAKMRMTSANVPTGWKYQTIPRTSDLKLLPWLLQSVGTHQTLMTGTIFVTSWSSPPHNPFGAVKWKRGSNFLLILNH